MEITRNVILDLLPLYHAGEASADTTALVEEYLRHHPEFASAAAPPADAALARLELPEGHEIKTLEKTKRAIRMRIWFMGCAIFFTLLPFSSAHIGDRIDFFLLRDLPVLAIVSFVCAAASWIAFWRTRRCVDAVMR